ncbi:MAG: ankyrin repeat domain-containing protein [Elusimicrobia bacterium]|nr:ankyrin repeat domain-containing protein [Elusimicrobiota bacterium]
MKRIVLAALVAPAMAAFVCAGELEKGAVSGNASWAASFAGFRALLEANAGDPAKARQKLLDEKLLSAVSSANIAEIRRLVAMGANPNAYDGFHATPLSTAVSSHGDLDVINALFELGAQVDFKGTCDYTALHEAARNGRLEAARILVAHRATVDAKACLGDTPLNEAAANGKSDVFKYLLGLGADPNASGYEGKTPLLHAVRLFIAPKDNEILAALLADSRTNVNAEDEDGMTALKSAVKAKSLETVKLLLAVPGLDVNNNSGGTTALFLAELNQYEEIAALLRAAGARQSVAAR